MDPLTTDDLLALIGNQQAQILQMQRHIAKLERSAPPLSDNGHAVVVESPAEVVAPG